MISLPAHNNVERNVSLSRKEVYSNQHDLKTTSWKKPCRSKRNGFSTRLATMRKYATLVTVLGLATAWFLLVDNHVVQENSVYVPGAGFSGFWFTLGRLQSISNPQDYDYYCFSAGCLGVATTLFTNQTIEDVVDKARGVQQGFKDGSIHRFSVVDHFVDDILQSVMRIEPQENITGELNDSRIDTTFLHEQIDFEHELLSRIHIITSTKKSWYRWQTSIRTPNNMSDLREMLIQTTWIPFATGKSMWHEDLQTGSLHMDGGVTALFHPKCKHFLGLPALRMPGLLLNFLNVKLGQSQAVAFWEAGLYVGLENR